MVHTGPDYSEEYRQELLYGFTDVGELSARQGINSFFNRSGNIVWYDDFESANAVKWISSCVGAGSTALSTDRAWMGNQSMKFVTDVNATDYCKIYKSISLPIARRLAIECMFCLTDNKPIVSIWFDGYTGTKLQQGAFRYDSNADMVQYCDSTWTWQDLSIEDHVSLTSEHWVPMKLVVDWDTGYYIRGYFAGTTYDLSSYALRSTLSPSNQFLIIATRVDAATNAAATAYCDNVILTQNE
jgi:hypothetical protein